MAGRHRAPARRSWTLPLAAGGAVIALAFTVGVLVDAAADPAAGGAASMADRTMPTTTTATTTTTTTTTTKSSTRKPKKKRPKPAPTSTKTTRKPTPTKPPARACSTVLEGTLPHVAQVGNHILTKFDVNSVGGRADRSGGSDHPSGLALDFMVDTATGNAVADYVLANQRAFGVKYVIWRQRYTDGSGWSWMEDRGSATANHYDHVHVSFHAGVPVSVTC